MRRREFIALVGWCRCVAACGTRAAAGQIYRVGLFSAGLPLGPASASFAAGSARVGLDQGKNIVFEGRYAEDRLDRLPALALTWCASTSMSSWR